MSSFWNPNYNATSSHRKRRPRNKGKQREENTAIPFFGSSTSARWQRPSSSSPSSSSKYEEEDLVLVRRKDSPPWWWLLLVEGTSGVTVMKAAKDEHGSRRRPGHRVLEPLVEGKVASFFPARLDEEE
ncbi:uncharacterized protein BO87DRAFT_45045 [Aspergillus neoniger CBS 115656]|uniref:Uncharacterized protein n=1 Tax=Aspergillus neoniger (strain CBS 115656) TaxID=1448310 RepID=A0A318YK21_ASPNB|nr:hypothetical protein BO87DRAFT_45045 [Aspergillus neoniger CBS 115656]PYH34901.1 hypothetical protein BO87DRAFT_45045 [Aspergillus neoniger CBS 115656]